jgi:hypothetical protein
LVEHVTFNHGVQGSNPCALTRKIKDLGQNRLLWKFARVCIVSATPLPATAEISMSDDRQSWRRAFEMLGPEQLRLRLEYRQNEYAGEYGREAERWLLEKAAEAKAIARTRFRTLRLWAIIGGVAAVVAALAGSIAAWPVVKGWLG